MYEKTNSMERLRSMGLNRHNTLISKNPNEILLAAGDMQRFTIRTDSREIRSELPFYMQKLPLTETGDKKLQDFLEAGLNENFAFIIADGIRHDEIQLYNGVAMLTINGDFSLEMSTAKVPLRKMYNHPTFFLSGHLTDRLHHLYCKGLHQYPKGDLLKDMMDLYQLGIFNKYVEFTKYPVKLGELNDQYVYWEVR